jgi:hypothetical protein
MSVKQKLRALERRLAARKAGWVIKLTDDLGHVVWSPRPPREGEEVHEIRIGGVDITQV